MDGPLAVDTYQLLSCFADLEPKIAFSRVRKRSYCNCVFAIGPCQNRPACRQLRQPRRRWRQLARPTVARGPDLRLLVFRTSTFCTAASLARHCTAKLHTTRWLSTAVQLLRKKCKTASGAAVDGGGQPTFKVTCTTVHLRQTAGSISFLGVAIQKRFFLRSYSYCFTPILRSCWLTNSFVNWLVAIILTKVIHLK